MAYKLLVLFSLVAATNGLLGGVIPDVLKNLQGLGFQFNGCTGNTTTEICRTACQCQCGGSNFRCGCETACKLVFFSNKATCGIGATTGNDLTPFAQCVYYSPTLENTDSLCVSICQCCDIPDAQCFEKCKTSVAGWLMGVACILLQDVPKVNLLCDAKDEIEKLM